MTRARVCARLSPARSSEARSTRRPRSRRAATSSARGVSRLCGSATTGRLRSARRAAVSRSSSARTRGLGASTQLGHLVELLGDVGHDPLGCVGGRRGPHVGDEVEQRGVRLVADRAHDRRPARGHGAHQRLVGERQQVLQRAAAAGDHDHVDLGVGVEPLQRRGDLGHRRRPLHRDLLDPEPDRRPAPATVLDDVLLGGRRAPARPRRHAGQERQRALAVGGEEPLRGQHAAEVLEAGQQLADAHLADLVGRQRQRAPRRRSTAAARAPRRSRLRRPRLPARRAGPPSRSR